MRLFRSSRTTALLSCLMLVFLCSIGFSADDKPERPGSPFREPMPKLPDEMLTDKRLDQPVKVFIKSKNLNEFFDLLSEKTGVHIGASHEIQGERPIVYFHDRPLRDVLTEISGLYGYYWLAKGEEGKWSYELFEDIRHSQKRTRARGEHRDDMDARILDTIRKGCEALKDPAALERMRSDRELYKCVTEPDQRAFLELLCRFDTSAIQAWLAGEKWAETFEKLPPGTQEAIRKYINAYNLKMRQEREIKEEFQPWTLDELSKVVVMLKGRVSQSDYSPAFITIRAGDPRYIRNNGTLVVWHWPSWEWGGENLLLDLPPTEIIGDPLPKDKKITAPARKYWFGDCLLVGDVLEAVSRQAGIDVIADGYLQDWWFDGIKDEPLDDLLSDLCSRMKYAGQFEGNLLRLRYIRWFEEPMMVEPPADMLARMWKEVEEDGTILFKDILDLAALPEAQLKWPGLDLLPGAEIATRATTTLKMWNSLSDAFNLDLEKVAASERKHIAVPVAQMNGEQQEAVYTWVKVIGASPSLSDLANSVVEFYVKIDNITTGKDVEVYTVDISFPDGNKRSMGFSIHNNYPVLTPEKRERVKKERRADREADEISAIGESE